MSTPFDDWLRRLAVAKKGPVTLYAHRNARFESTVSLPGNFTGATLRGEIRQYPDQAGAALADFEVSGPVVADGRSTFTIYMTPDSLEVLPADSDLNGEEVFAYDLLLTPASDFEELLFAGTFILLGGITQ